MAIELTPERITELLLEFSIEKLQVGTAPDVVELDLIRQGAQPEVAKLLVKRAQESLNDS